MDTCIHLLHQAIIDNNEEEALALAASQDVLRVPGKHSFTACDLARHLGRRKLLHAWGLWPGIKLWVQLKGEDSVSLLEIEEVEKKLGFQYSPWLYFSDYKTLIWAIKTSASGISKKKVETESRWLGSWYRSEIESGQVAPVAIRYIDDDIGYGLFLREDVPENAFICEYSGLVEKKSWFSEPDSNYYFRYPSSRWSWTTKTIDSEFVGNVARFVNHSDIPNVEPLAVASPPLMHIILYALRPIKKGEQLLYDYGPRYWRKGGVPQQI